MLRENDRDGMSVGPARIKAAKIGVLPEAGDPVRPAVAPLVRVLHLT